MTPQDFTIGDVVYLKSGGPPMTVEGLANPRKTLSARYSKEYVYSPTDVVSVFCVWFWDGTVHRGKFLKETLKHER